MIPGADLDTGPLPADIGQPRRDLEDVKMWAGVIVGGMLLAVTLALAVLGVVIVGAPS